MFELQMGHQTTGTRKQFNAQISRSSSSLHLSTTPSFPLSLGGLSLHLNHLIASRMANYDWRFETLPFGIFWSNLDTMGLETYPRTYSGQI